MRARIIHIKAIQLQQQMLFRSMFSCIKLYNKRHLCTLIYPHAGRESIIPSCVASYTWLSKWALKASTYCGSTSYIWNWRKGKPSIGTRILASQRSNTWYIYQYAVENANIEQQPPSCLLKTNSRGKHHEKWKHQNDHYLYLGVRANKSDTLTRVYLGSTKATKFSSVIAKLIRLLQRSLDSISNLLHYTIPKQ